ncbi:glycosyltransferase [Cohnella fermenti]|uniref:Glycosyltransferase n=1 Tax=Cohnella fermenti TaxID=2565925 RepID=A0A4S4C0N4_9BACL|nr:glycosyltransferase [Cohnella fermenti]THF79045.1 glycosyltransferase [Cohnella fermenti]
MNIAFDMFFARTEARRRGIGRYSHNLIHAMITSDTGHSYYYFYPDLSKGLASLKRQLQQFLLRNRIDVYHIMSPFYLFHLRPDLFAQYRHMLPDRSWFGTVRVAVTLYDVIPLVYEEQFLNNDNRQVYWSTIELIRSCDAIFAISETTKQDAVRLAGLDPDRIVVIMAGLDPQFAAAATERRRDASQAYGIRRPYVMCTGGTDPRKNATALIRAFLDANARLGRKHQLVLACAISEGETIALRRLAAAAGDAAALVTTGYVPDAELVELYKGAVLFAFPSLYEGFGLPVLEAMACGTPVLTSDGSSLKEISGEAACLVDPTSTKAISEKLAYLLSHPDQLKRLSQQGRKQAAKFTWEKASRLVLETYEAITRRKAAIVAPYAPPYATAVGLLPLAAPYLVNDVDIDLYLVGESRDLQLALEDDGAIRRLDLGQFAERSAAYDHIVYEFGDDSRYDAIAPLLHRYPGIVVTGDADFHALAIRTTLERNRLEAYYRVLESEFGSAEAHEKLDRLLAGSLQPEAIKLLRHYLGKAHAVVAYGDKQRAELVKAGCSPVLTAPVPVPEKDGVIKTRGEGFLFSSFGPHRDAEELLPLLAAMKQLKANPGGRRPIGLRISGPYLGGTKEQLLRQANSLGIGDRVEIADEPGNAAQAEKEWRETDVAVQLGRAEAGRLAYAPYLALGYGVPLIVREEVMEPSMQEEETLAFRIREGQDFDDRVLQAMLSLYRNESLREAYSRDGRAYAQRTLTAAAYAEVVRQAMFRTRTEDEETAIWTFSMTPGGVPKIVQVQRNNEERGDERC